jgi:hypothetical protein
VPGTLGVGSHTLKVIFASGGVGDTTSKSFHVDSASVPVVRMNSSAATVGLNSPPVTLTVTAVGGGGTTPLFTFAKDRLFTQIVQAEGPAAYVSVNVSSLTIGNNEFYVRMRTSDSCYSAATGVDSVAVVMVDSTVGILPPAPKVIQLQAHYCGALGTQSVTIANLPAAPATWSATMDGVATAVTAGRIFFTPNALGAGTHILQVVFTNPAGSDTSNFNFQVDAVHSPGVALHSSSTTVDVTVSTVVLTATATSGGAMPTYTFAKDIAFSNIIQRESTSNSVTVDVSTLTVGRNVFYVRMKTSDSCTTASTSMDSVVVTLQEPGSRMIDLDNPGQPIIAGPNPVSGRLAVYGLMPSKSYSITLLSGKGQALTQRQVEGQTQTTVYIDPRQTGLYFLRVYDVTKGRVIGFVKVLAVAQK